MGKVDWSKAPEGAEFSVCGNFYFASSRFRDTAYFWSDTYEDWLKSDFTLKDIKGSTSYEERPREDCETATDCVKSPIHYQLIDGIESIEIIARSMTKERWKGFCLGNILKYRIRAGKKDELQQDIDKANFYGELYEMHKGKCYE